MGKIYYNEIIEEDEEFCLFLENVIVLIWLRFFYLGFFKFVKYMYGMELCVRILVLIKFEILQVLELFLEEFRISEDVKFMRILIN